MYWGNVTAEDSSDAEAVFDGNNGFAGVWHLNEDLLDATSNNNDGSDSGVSDIPGMVAGAQDFVGSSSFIRVEDDNSLDFGEGDFTATAWIKIDNLSTRQVFCKRITGGGNYELQLDDNKLRIYVEDAFDSKDLYGSTTLSTGTWYHVVFRRASDVVFLYLNGSQETGTLSSTHDVGSNNSLYIGKDPYLGEYFDGIIDEFRLSGVARSPDWIKLCWQNQKDAQSLVMVNAPYLPLTGGTMLGDIAMGDNDILDADSVSATVLDAGRIVMGDWALKVPDYVFDKGYKLPSLESVEEYIRTHGHLPYVPGAGEINAKGMDLGKMTLVYLRHVEEINLHLIRQDKLLRNLDSGK
jgi:hypothetical protein